MSAPVPPRRAPRRLTRSNLVFTRRSNDLIFQTAVVRMLATPEQRVPARAEDRPPTRGEEHGRKMFSDTTGTHTWASASMWNAKSLV